MLDRVGLQLVLASFLLLAGVRVIAVPPTSETVAIVFNVSDAASLLLAAQRASLLGSADAVLITLAPGEYSLQQIVEFSGPGSVSLIASSDSTNTAFPRLLCTAGSGTALSFSANTSSVTVHGLSFSGCNNTAFVVNLQQPLPPLNGSSGGGGSSHANVTVSASSFVNCGGVDAGAMRLSFAEAGPTSSNVTTNSSSSNATASVTLSGCTFEANNVVIGTAAAVAGNASNAVAGNSTVSEAAGSSTVSGHAAAITAGPGTSLDVTIDGNSSFSGNGAAGGGGGAATLYIGCGGTSNSSAGADVSNAAAAECSLHLGASTWVQNSAAAASGALLDCGGSSGCSLSVEGASFLGNTQDYGTAGEDPGLWNNTDKVCLQFRMLVGGTLHCMLAIGVNGVYSAVQRGRQGS